MTEKIWFITGGSRGFGNIWARAALNRGDKVALTARNIGALRTLSDKHGRNVLPLQVDVTDHNSVMAAVKKAHGHFGRPDVVLSNAGYGLMGAIEEVTVEDVRANFDTNVIGTFSVVQAAVPLMREQGAGHVLAVSSVGGLVTFPLGGTYQATNGNPHRSRASR